MSDVMRRIKRAWFPPKGHENDIPVVTFTVHKGGDISALRLKKSSGVTISDEAALQAVENAAPFRPLPIGGPETVDVEWHPSTIGQK